MKSAQVNINPIIDPHQPKAEKGAAKELKICTGTVIASPMQAGMVSPHIPFIDFF